MNISRDWRRTADALHYALMCLEDDPIAPKNWRRAYQAMGHYEALCKTTPKEETADDCT